MGNFHSATKSAAAAKNFQKVEKRCHHKPRRQRRRRPVAGTAPPAPPAQTRRRKRKRRRRQKDLDLEQRNRGVWLVKVPNYIAQRWEQATKPNETVAKLTIERVPGKKPVVSLKLDEKLTKAMPEAEWTSTTKGIIPQEHKFVVNPVNMQHLAVLSNTRGGGVSG